MRFNKKSIYKDIGREKEREGFLGVLKDIWRSLVF